MDFRGYEVPQIVTKIAARAKVNPQDEPERQQADHYPMSSGQACRRPAPASRAARGQRGIRYRIRFSTITRKNSLIAITIARTVRDVKASSQSGLILIARRRPCKVTSASTNPRSRSSLKGGDGATRPLVRKRTKRESRAVADRALVCRSPSATVLSDLSKKPAAAQWPARQPAQAGGRAATSAGSSARRADETSRAGRNSAVK